MSSKRGAVLAQEELVLHEGIVLQRAAWDLACPWLALVARRFCKLWSLGFLASWKSQECVSDLQGQGRKESGDPAQIWAPRRPEDPGQLHLQRYPLPHSVPKRRRLGSAAGSGKGTPLSGCVCGSARGPCLGSPLLSAGCILGGDNGEVIMLQQPPARAQTDS